MVKKVVRLYTGTDGESHFEDTELHLECKVGIGRGHITRAVDN